MAFFDRFRRRRFRPPRRLKFTRLGRWYTGLTIVLGLAAINTGNNLLFLLLGLLLAGIVLSGVISETTLLRLRVERRLPTDARAGEPALVGLIVTNGKKRQASFAVVARDVTTEGAVGQSFALRLEPGESRELLYRWDPKHRGQFHFTQVDLVTRFPFGLFEKWREFDAEGDAVVLPRRVPSPPLRPRRSVTLGEQPSSSAGPGTEFFALRDLRSGDDARLIHWRTSARRGRAVVVEREREKRRRVVVRLDNTAEGAALDDAVERAAAAVTELANEGCEVAFSARGTLVPSGAGGAHTLRIHRVLAVLGSATPELAPPVSIPGAEVVDIPLAGAAKAAA